MKTRSFSWWDEQEWKPQPPAAAETHRPGHPAAPALPQGEQKWRLNNPKKRHNPGRGLGQSGLPDEAECTRKK